MTVVFEGAALAALVGAAVGAGHKEEEQRRAEERVAQDLYRRFFHADLLEHSPERRTVVGESLPSGVDPRAAASVKTIEYYQDRKVQYWLGVLKSTAERSGEIQTRVLEELKQWLSTVTEASTPSRDVGQRLEYCRQLLLNPSIFGPTLREVKDGLSFFRTLGEVCQQLDALWNHLVANERASALRLERIVSLGSDLADMSFPVLFFSLPSSSVISCAASSASSVPEPIILAAAAAAARGEGAGDLVTDWRSDAGQLLQAMLAGGTGAVAVQRSAASATNASADAGTGSARVLEVIEQVRARWSTDTALSERSSGLATSFCTPESRAARESYIDFCDNLERFRFFVGVLRPYIQLANAAGDLATCRLNQSLSHLLQELDSVLGQLRVARLETMGAAKRHLRVLAARIGAGGISADERRWMQGLRHVDETRLDELHRNIVCECTQVRVAATEERASELRADAQQGIRDIVRVFNSADFLARCKLPDGIAKELTALANGPTQAALEVD